MEDNEERKKPDTDSDELESPKKSPKRISSLKLSIKKKDKKPKPKSKKKDTVVIPYLNQMPNEVLRIIFTFMEAKELVS